MPEETAANLPVVDRSRITYGQRKRGNLLPKLIERAERDLDTDALETLYDEFDRLVMSVVVSLPDGWLPDGVTLETPKWIESLSGDHYDQVIEAMTPESAEKKGG